MLTPSAEYSSHQDQGNRERFLAGFGWVAMGIGVVSLFERRPWTYAIVNGGPHAVA